ncbi:hypothetical protein ACFYUK_44820 [Nonomuraea wenchangensis]
MTLARTPPGTSRGLTSGGVTAFKPALPWDGVRDAVAPGFARAAAMSPVPYGFLTPDRARARTGAAVAALRGRDRAGAAEGGGERAHPGPGRDRP